MTPSELTGLMIILRHLPGALAVRTPGLFYSITQPVPMPCGTWLLWTVVLEKTLESPLDCKEIQPVNPIGSQSWGIHWKDWCWSWNSNTLATWWEELSHLKRPWCWERLRAGGEGDDRGWENWMASPTQWTRVCIKSGSWWWPGRPGVLQSMGSQRVGHYWVTKLNWTDPTPGCPMIFKYEFIINL